VEKQIDGILGGDDFSDTGNVRLFVKKDRSSGGIQSLSLGVATRRDYNDKNKKIRYKKVVDRLWYFMCSDPLSLSGSDSLSTAVVQIETTEKGSEQNLFVVGGKLRRDMTVCYRQCGNAEPSEQEEIAERDLPGRLDSRASYEKTTKLAYRCLVHAYGEEYAWYTASVRIDVMRRVIKRMGKLIHLFFIVEQVNTHTHTHTHARARAHIPTRTHTHTHTHTHNTHTHTQNELRPRGTAVTLRYSSVSSSSSVKIC
jgi:hypothetical protein